MNDKKTIPFMTELKKYIDHRSVKIAEKNAVLENLKKELSLKKDEISKVEAEYKKSFDDSLFDKLIQLKKDADSIQDNVIKISEIINLMNTGEFNYDLEDLEKEIDSYIEKIGFEELKKSVIAAKENYEKGIENFHSKLKDVYKLRASMDQMKDNIPKDTRDKIIEVLNKHCNDFQRDNNMFIDSYEYNKLPLKLNSAAINIYLRNQYGI